MLELRAGLCPGLFEDDLAAGPSRAHRFLPLGRSHGGMSCLGHAKTKIVIAIVHVAANSTKMTSSMAVVFANGVSGFTVITAAPKVRSQPATNRTGQERTNLIQLPSPPGHQYWRTVAAVICPRQSLGTRAVAMANPMANTISAPMPSGLISLLRVTHRCSQETPRRLSLRLLQTRWARRDRRGRHRLRQQPPRRRYPQRRHR